MKITFNNLENSNNIVTFSHCPNILTVSEEETQPLEAQLELNINKVSNLVPDKKYYIKINNSYIYSVWSVEKETGTFFLLINNNSDQYIKYITDSIIRALRNVKSIDSNYNIYHKIDSNGIMTDGITIKAKEIGSKFNISFETNLPTESYSIKLTEGTSSNEMLKGIKNKINVDVYKAYPASRINSTTTGEMIYITSLSKNYTGGSCSFDMSPILSSVAEYGKLNECSFNVYITSDNKLLASQYLTKIFATTGYLINQGEPFIPNFDGAIFAQNLKRGSQKPYFNNTVLYLYDRTLPVSIYTTDNIKELPLKIRYINSADEVVKENSTTFTPTSSLTTINYILDNDYTSYNYIEVDIDGIDNLRYNIIKPVTGTSECNRVYWTNSYGGTSFFDFVGDKTENRKVKTETYQSQLFDYYKKIESERDIVIGKDVDITVDLSTHNIEKDAQWLLFDLENSTNAWINVNSKLYKIIIIDLSIKETNVKDILTATISYKYSLGDTF